MSPRGPGAVALTLGFTSPGRTRCHLSYGGAEIQLLVYIYFLPPFPHPGAISLMGAIFLMGAIPPMGAISRRITVRMICKTKPLYHIWYSLGRLDSAIGNEDMHRARKRRAYIAIERKIREERQKRRRDWTTRRLETIAAHEARARQTEASNVHVRTLDE